MLYIQLEFRTINQKQNNNDNNKKMIMNLMKRYTEIFKKQIIDKKKRAV